MMKEKIKIALIKQSNRELESSHIYLNMASWSESNGFDGVCNFLYDHSNEERYHMLKLIRYLNGRGGDFVKINYDNKFYIKNENYESLEIIFEKLFEHEKLISHEINLLLELSLKEKDHFTYNFLQWFVKEQIEEESLIKMLLNKIQLIKNNQLGIYLFDKSIKNIEINNKKL
ncbi:ferritin [Blattabacterium cuenoti]|uniref:ferritin n=1 Tax=Blattabacterium cuenoti TaxID=1653831 RepID=UPI00163CC153|nr:ferritin [Blattabacterium cuenoti]